MMMTTTMMTTTTATMMMAVVMLMTMTTMMMVMVMMLMVRIFAARHSDHLPRLCQQLPHLREAYAIATDRGNRGQAGGGSWPRGAEARRVIWRRYYLGAVGILNPAQEDTDVNGTSLGVSSLADGFVGRSGQDLARMGRR